MKIFIALTKQFFHCLFRRHKPITTYFGGRIIYIVCADCPTIYYTDSTYSKRSDNNVSST